VGDDTIEKIEKFVRMALLDICELDGGRVPNQGSRSGIE